MVEAEGGGQSEILGVGVWDEEFSDVSSGTSERGDRSCTGLCSE